MGKGSSNYRLVHLRDYEPISQEVLKSLPEGLVRRQLVVPVSKANGRLVVAAIPKEEGQVKPEGIQLVARCPVELVLAPQEEIEAFIELHYSDQNSTLKPVVADIPEMKSAVKDVPPLSEAFERLLTNAAVNRASEILIERDGDRLHVRHRIRGVLVSDMKIALNLQDLSTIADFVGKSGEQKTEGGVTWAGAHFGFTSKAEAYTCAAFFSETPKFASLTVRITKTLDKSFAPHLWGMGPQQSHVLETFLSKSQGLILFCGNDSADLSTMIHACAKELATPEKHLFAVTDTPEIRFPGNDQLVSNGDAEQFQKFLKLAFRHSPDILVAHPIQRRDQMETCLEESLKGRLVLGRMYASDASDAMLQLLGMGVEPYLIGSALLGIVVQRALRLNCPKCQEKDVVPRDRLKEFGIPIAMQPAAFFRGKGCENCCNSGFDRESNIFEVLEMSDDLRNRLTRDMKPDAFRSAVKANGMMTLRQVAIHKAINGQTALSEVLRVTA